MAMNIQEEFNNQWRDIQDVVLSDAKRQIKFHGRVNKEDLTKKLEQETSKWQRGVLVRGVLYQEMVERNDSNALLFAETAKRFQFEEPRHNRIPSFWWLDVICLIPVAIMAIVLHCYTEMNTIEEIFYPTLIYVFLSALCVPVKNKKKDQTANQILSDIESQMSGMKLSLDQYL